MALPRPAFPPVTQADRDLFNPFTNVEAPEDGGGPFRIGELSRRSGVAVGTIKFYLREGLVPVGEPTAKTQALYTVAHLRRLRLVRVLAEVGGLSIAQIREVIEVLDAGGDLPGELAQLVSYSIDATRSNGSRSREGNDAAAWAQAREATDAFVGRLGFEVDPDAPSRTALADALHALRTLRIAQDPLIFTEHARLAYELAEFEMGVIDPVTDRSAAVEAVAVGSVVFGAAFMALRAMAQEHEARRRIDQDPAAERIGEER
ncbi:MAG: MerR family transcriptional regulator [Solirubrobacteraceae bacterium]|nr:MerR family transcriptional regulator [Solirubrobacteraceae bacterium]